MQPYAQADCNDMIRRLTGSIIDITVESVIVDVHGVGYEVSVAPDLISRLRIGEQQTLVIYTHVREDALHLFGFLHEAERQLFVWLLDISGVGPKTALQIVGRGTNAVIEAVRMADTGFFQGIPRVGKKVAQKLVLELQPKVGRDQPLALGPDTPLRADLRTALAAMGFAERDMQRVVDKVDESMKIEDAIRWAMRELREGAHA